MKPKKRLTLYVVITFSLLLAAYTVVQAATDPQIALSANKARIKVRDEISVEILIKNAPSIYGADVRIEFDPNCLQIVDSDTRADGVQVENGNFFNIRRSYFLQYQMDNTLGKIDYALTHLNPAPAVQGNGLLARIRFKGVRVCRTSITVTEGQFGTKAGEVISPTLGSVSVQITRSSAGSSDVDPSETTSQTAQEQAGNDQTPLITPILENKVAVGIIGTGVIGAGVIGFRFLLKRAHR